MKKSKRINARQKAARRTAAGRLTRVVFAKIGGKECPRFGPMIWKERDKFMATPEGELTRAAAYRTRAPRPRWNRQSGAGCYPLRYSVIGFCQEGIAAGLG